MKQGGWPMSQCLNSTIALSKIEKNHSRERLFPDVLGVSLFYNTSRLITRVTAHQTFPPCITKGECNESRNTRELEGGFHA